MNSKGTRTDGRDTITNKRKRGDDGKNDDVLEQLGEMESLDNKTNAEDASISTLPDTLLLHIFHFVLGKNDNAACSAISARGAMQPYTTPRVGSTCIGKYCGEQLKLQLALEKTCRRFYVFLRKDCTMRHLYENVEGYPQQFTYRVETMHEKIFIANACRMVKQFQESTDNQLCLYMGGADGVRHLIDKILMTKMEHPCDPQVAYPFDMYRNIHGVVSPPEFPENGFKLFLRGDSIAYLVEVVEQHMCSKLNNAWSAALFRSNPPNIHPYPMLCSNDIQFVDSIHSSDLGISHICSVYRGHHCCRRLSVNESPKIWQWPEDDCLDDDILEAERRQHMVRAIASRAGIVKLSGALFDPIAAEILHFMATIVIDAFEASKSLWCPGANINVTRLVAIDDELIGEESDDASARSNLEFDYITNHPPPSRLDEDGRHVCVIIPRMIKDAAIRLGMKPLLDSHSWEVSEGCTEKGEVSEALSLYGLSLDDESESETDSDSEESAWQPSIGEEDGSEHEL